MQVWRRVPSDPSDWFSEDELARSRAHHRPLGRMERVATVVWVAVVLVLLRSHELVRLTDDVRPWPLAAALAVSALVLVEAAVNFPFDAAKHRRERAAGIGTESAGTFARQRLGAAVVGAIVVSGLFVALQALVRATDAWWWMAAIVVGGLAAGLSAAYPLVILPLFNRVEPLGDDALRRRLLLFCRDSGLPVPAVGVIDTSKHKQSTAHNAFVAGLGPRRIVVLHDTVLDDAPAVAEYFLAHELGHLRKHHVAQRLGIVAAAALPAFLVTQAVATSPAVLRFAGLGSLRDPAGAALLVPIVIYALTVVGLLSAWHGRVAERQADLEALELTRDPDSVIAAIRQLAAANHADLDPPLLTRLTTSTPPPHERLAAVERWRATRRAALLFTDIVGSTETVERLGDLRWFELLRDHDEIVAHAVSERGGRVIDHTGDGFVLEFPDTGAAVLAAVDVQRALADVDGTERIHVRAGVHVGDVIRHGGNVHGREVHLAARVGAAAGSGEILVSDAVRQELDSSARFEFGEPRPSELKGFEGLHALHPVTWQVAAATAELVTAV